MATDPCVEAAELKKIRRDLIAGEKATAVRFGEDEVRYTKADLPRLDGLIAEAEKQCAITEGKTPKRTRYAMGVRFRPY
ncbi:gpW family head-tail joining protein [Palleronia sp.]|uniref:gpW family head-tail joining protein n=1 Tax=Palleronia sp. TaxID=1940284 RepID=UPI0035C8215F